VGEVPSGAFHDVRVCITSPVRRVWGRPHPVTMVP
jgi:hypothetical protein